MKRRRLGSIDLRADGYRARLRGVTIGTFSTEQEAEDAIALYAQTCAEAQPTAGMSLRTWGRKWLEARELDETHRDTKNEGYVWQGRIATAAFIDLPLAAITTKDVRDWVKLQLRTPYQRKNRKGKAIGLPKKPARQTVKNALNLLRSCLQGACEDNLLEQNPATGVLVPKKATTEDPWTWLETHEIAALTGDKVAEEPRDVFQFAIYTALREGELFGLQWPDVDMKARKAKIRHSWKGKPTKVGVTRELHLFGPAVEVLERQQRRTGDGLYVFARADGEPYSKGYDADIGAWLEKAGITRPVRFHDLRHTCASHLVSGSWGRAWTIEEVARHLGHSTSITARRYAHLSPEGIARAVRETRPELARLIQFPVSNDVSTSVQEPEQQNEEGAQVLEISGREGIRTPGEVTPTPVFKEGGGLNASGDLRPNGHYRDTALALLMRLREGKCTQGEVLAIAQDVLDNVPPRLAAARRFMAAVNTAAEGLAAAQLLEMLLCESPAEALRLGKGGVA